MLKPLPSNEERIWAVGAHLSALAMGMGLLLPVVGWSEQRSKSKYASFQCLQALGYQSLGYTVWVLSALVIFIVLLFIALAEFGAAAASGEDITALLAPTMVVHFVVMMGLIGVYFALPIIAAVACALGKDFYYPIMGKRLARYVGYASSIEQEGWIEEHEDRWVVSMGHFAVIIMLWGMLASLTAWILQSKRSLFLKFQSTQTLVFQVCVTLLFFGGILFYIAGAFVLLGAIGLSGGAELTSTGIVGLVIFLIFLLIFLVILLIVPVFHIMGQWAGYRVLKGDNYYYPILGRLIEKRISNNKVEENVK
jgi:uncharacterized Tic20 family protein